MTDERLLFGEFVEWTDEILDEKMPPGVVAFCIHISEREYRFDVQIVGSRRFDPADPDWACDEAFSSQENVFAVSVPDASEKREEALRVGIGWASRYLEVGRNAPVLRASRAVALGFVDGDLHMIWPEDAVASCEANDRRVLGWDGHPRMKA